MPSLLIPLLGGGGEGLDRDLIKGSSHFSPFTFVAELPAEGHNGLDLPSTAESQMQLILFSLLVFYTLAICLSKQKHIYFTTETASVCYIKPIFILNFSWINCLYVFNVFKRAQTGRDKTRFLVAIVPPMWRCDVW
jgi:hypothetical protein